MSQPQSTHCGFRDKAQKRGIPDDLVPLVIGAMLPDIIDKSLYGFELSPYGRTIGHSIFLWVACTGLWVLWKSTSQDGWKGLGAFVAGGWSHLVSDLVNDAYLGYRQTGYVFSGWFGLPLLTPDDWQVIYAGAAFERCSLCVSAVEYGVILAVGLSVMWTARPLRPWQAHDKRV